MDLIAKGSANFSKGSTAYHQQLYIGCLKRLLSALPAPLCQSHVVQYFVMQYVLIFPPYHQDSRKKNSCNNVKK